MTLQSRGYGFGTYRYRYACYDAFFNAVIVFTYYKGALSANEGVMQVGQISVFASYVVQILMNLVMISMMLLQLARGKACAERVVEVLDTEIDIVNPENAFVPKSRRVRLNLKM